MNLASLLPVASDFHTISLYYIFSLTFTVSKPEKSLAQIESNHVENNRGNGILYEGREGIVISKNRVSGNSKHGITLLRSNEITVEVNIFLQTF